MSSVLDTYARKAISFKEGKGSYLFAENGDKYLDFVQGIATNILGHCHDHLIQAIQVQSKREIIKVLSSSTPYTECQNHETGPVSLD